jgi:hypothetical protein
MRIRTIAFTLAVLVAAASPALAQNRVEVSGFFGWTFSDGVSGDAVLASDGNVYDKVDPKDSMSWGLLMGFLVNPNTEVGFMYSRQQSKLVFGGTTEREVGDLAISGYHAYFAYNFGPDDAVARPFVFGGLGATNFGSVDFNIGGVPRSTGSETQFSSTWGAGIKLFPGGGKVGARIAVRYTPTYVKTDAAGWWCDPYWGCYLVGDAQYANQFEFSGGLTIRF